MGENSIVPDGRDHHPHAPRQVPISLVLDQTARPLEFAAAGSARMKAVLDGRSAGKIGKPRQPSDKISLVAHKMAAITYASDELLDDSAISLEAFLSGPMAWPVACRMDGKITPSCKRRGSADGPHATRARRSANRRKPPSASALTDVAWRCLSTSCLAATACGCSTSKHLSNLYTNRGTRAATAMFIANANERAPARCSAIRHLHRKDCRCPARLARSSWPTGAIT